MKTHLICALALTLTTACLPTLNTQEDSPDASLDASPSAGEFAFSSVSRSVRLGVTGSEDTPIEFINAEACEGSPILSTTDQDVISFEDDTPNDSAALLSPEGAGVGILKATCGAQFDTLEVVVLPVDAVRLSDVRLWSRGDLGVEFQAGADTTKSVSRWRNLARQSPHFGQDEDAQSPHYDNERGEARLSFRISSESNAIERPAGLTLLDEDEEKSPLTFEDSVTALFVVETKEEEERFHALLESNVGGIYNVLLNTTDAASEKVGVGARPVGAIQEGMRWRHLEMPASGSAKGTPFGVVLERQEAHVKLTPYPYDQGREYTISLPPSTSPVFSVETLGLSRFAITNGDEALTGHVYEVLLIDAALAPDEVAQVLAAMKKQVSF